MKHLAILMLCLTTLIGSFGQDSKDELEIKNLVQKEVKAYLTHDFDTWSTCWAHTDYAHHYYTSQNYHQGLDGWAAMTEAFEEEFSMTPPSDYFIEKNGYNILVKGNLAFASLKEIYISKAGIEPSVWHAINNASFEKIDGEWKIIGYNIVNKSTFSASDYDVLGQLNALGSMLMEMNNQENALKVFNLCTELSTEDECKKYNRLGDFFMARGSKDIATGYYSRCIETEPENEHALKQLEKLGVR